MKYFELLVVFIVLTLIAHAQTHVVFLDDTLFYHTISGSYWFNDSLSDGRWDLYDVYRKDSMSIKKWSDHLLLSEAFNAGLRHGRSYRYRYSYDKKRRSLFLSMIVDYQNGEIDGEFVLYRSAGEPAYEWSISNNQLHGLCVTYDMKPQNYGKVLTISFFDKDSLIGWNDYKNGKEIVGRGVRLNDGNIEYSIFENNNLKYKCYYKDYYLVKYHEYSTQTVEKVCDGPFHPINMKDFIFCIYLPQYLDNVWSYKFYETISYPEE